MKTQNPVQIPAVAGKIVLQKSNGTTYVKYEYDRVYIKQKGYNIPKRATIGRVCDNDASKMFPNQNFVKYFPDVEIPGVEPKFVRSSSLKLGAYVVIKHIIEKSGLKQMISALFDNDSDARLFMDIATYTIISEDNAGQYYPDYAFCHPLFTPKMHIYSDSKVSDFLQEITHEHSSAFLNAWNAARADKDKIYISYDSTNKNTQAGDIDMAEYGHPKENAHTPIFNYAIAYDCNNSDPLFYEAYCGSIVDVSQLQLMIAKAEGYGYKNTGFVFDRGYFSKSNLLFMDRCGFDFIIMTKGNKDFVSKLILENKGTFESSRACAITDYHAYGKTIIGRLYEDDTKDRYFHLYYSATRCAAERNQIEFDLDTMRLYLEKHIGKTVSISEPISRYYNLEFVKIDGKNILKSFSEKDEAIERDIKLCGYYVIISAKEHTAADALCLYKGRDASEKLYRADKSYLGDKSMRVYSNESHASKIFIEFVALIIRNRIYTALKNEMRRIDKKRNYMTVPAAIRELEKIEMSRQLDNVYRLDHAITATQKAILKAFNLTETDIKTASKEVSETLNQQA